MTTAVQSHSQRGAKKRQAREKLTQLNRKAVSEQTKMKPKIEKQGCD